MNALAQADTGHSSPPIGESEQQTSLSIGSCDIAIVGYSPVGMTCAALLTREGLRARYPEETTP
jgi:ribulose 1,5-bisphosphate synthetase/thiazole synthase